MRYALCAVALVGALLFSACAPFGADPTPVPSVAALETQAAAVRALNDARATLAAGPPPPPPAVLTRQAVPAEIQTATAAVEWTAIANIWATVTAEAAP